MEDIFTQTRARIDEHEVALTGVDERTHLPGTEQTYRGVLQVMRDTLADAENLYLSLHPVAADAFALGIRVGLLDSALHSLENIGKPAGTE